MKLATLPDPLPNAPRSPNLPVVKCLCDVYLGRLGGLGANSLQLVQTYPGSVNVLHRPHY